MHQVENFQNRKALNKITKQEKAKLNIKKNFSEKKRSERSALFMNMNDNYASTQSMYTPNGKFTKFLSRLNLLCSGRWRGGASSDVEDMSDINSEISD